MKRVKVFGAGSIGCHLSNACRKLNWQVDMLDIDPLALERVKTEIYPSRYGKWDDEINLYEVKDHPKTEHDLIIIGTPPDFHIEIALRELKANPPKVMLIEKPLCTPALEGCDELLELAKTTKTTVLVGYNHNLTRNSSAALNLINQDTIGDALSISAFVREYWGGIFAAHPWLDGPKASYLGFWNRGGGATGEHSHSISAWQMFAHHFNKGRVCEVSSTMRMVKDSNVDYDEISYMQLTTEKGFLGDVTQDVITKPTNKSLRIQGTNGFLEWIVNKDKDNDAIIYSSGEEATKTELFKKSRPDDFRYEIEHIEKILNGTEDGAKSVISLERGLDTMMVISAAYKSAQNKRPVKIDYSNGYSQESLHLA